MEGKKTFNAYCDWYEQFKELDDETAGKLIKLILAYVNDLNPEESLPNGSILKILFAPYKTTLKRDLKKWQLKCEKNKESIQKYWDEKKSKQTNTNEYERIQTYTDKDKDKDTDKDRDRDNDTHLRECVIYTPTLDEITDYIHKNNYVVNPNNFFRYYEANGWDKVNDWMKTVDYWNSIDLSKGRSIKAREREEELQQGDLELDAKTCKILDSVYNRL